MLVEADRRAAIVTDSNSGITPARAKELGIHLIPMPFLVDGTQYLEGVDCTEPFFFSKLESGAAVSTSQPSPGEVTALWERLLREHEAVLHFPMTSELSNSCQTARALAREYPGRVFVVDNRRISVTLMQSILDARRLLERGMAPAEVCAVLEREALNASIYLTVNTLEYLKKSGRVTAAAAAMATVLNLKPVLQIQGGRLDAYRKVRGMQQARAIMLEALRRDLTGRFAGMDTAIFAAYTADRAAGEQWKAEIEEALGRPVHMEPLPLSICCHVGAGVLGIGCAKKL